MRQKLTSAVQTQKWVPLVGRTFRIFGFLVLGVLVVVGAWIFLVFNFGTAKISLLCQGSWTAGDLKGQPETVAAVIERYQPWYLFVMPTYNGSEGNLKVQSKDSELVEYFSYMHIVGFEGELGMYEFRDKPDAQMRGGYLKAFQELTVDFYGGNVFTGTCDDRH